MDTFFKKHWFKLVMGSISLVLIAIILNNTFSTKVEFPMSKDARDFELTDTFGESVTLSDTSGQVRLLYFFFSNCPDVCPPTTYGLTTVQDELIKKGYYKKDASLISITLDPERDTAEQIKRFVSNYDIDLDGWSFLRGDEDYTKQLANDYGLMVSINKETGDVAHSNIVTLIDGENRVRKYYAGDNIDFEQVASDTIALIKQSR